MLQERMVRSEKVNAGRLLAPGSRIGIWARNLLFSTLARVGRRLMKLIDRPASNIDLPDYEGLDRQAMNVRR